MSFLATIATISSRLFGDAPANTVALALAIPGAISVVLALYRILRFIYINFIFSNNLGKYRKYGEWAVVTGSSDGIGKAMAFDLAKKKFNIVFVARNKEKLQAVAKELQDTGCTVETRIVVLDFAKATQEQYARAFEEIDKLNVSVLVNNIGVSYEHPEFFAEVPVTTDLDMLKVNCESQICFTKAILKSMIARKCKGAIVNLSSINGIVPAPLLTTYGATKAFNKQFSEALSFEVKKNGIDVIAITPGYVCTNMSGIKRQSFMNVMPKPMARQTLAKIGGALTNAGHWHHDLFISIVNLFPASLVGGQVLALSLGVRNRALKKKAAAATAAASKSS